MSVKSPDSIKAEGAASTPGLHYSKKVNEAQKYQTNKYLPKIKRKLRGASGKQQGHKG